MALALTNLVFDLVNLVNLVTNLAKPSLDLDKTGPGVDTIFRKSTTPPTPPTHPKLF